MQKQTGYYPLHVYQSKNSKGNMLMLTRQKRSFLTVGHCTAEIFSYDRTELKFISALPQGRVLTLTEENGFKPLPS